MNTPGHRTHDVVTVIAFPEHPLDKSVRGLRSRSERALAAGAHAIVVDLRAVQRIDTRTLSELCVALRRISQHRAPLTVVGADQRVQWVITLCELDTVSLHSTMPAALASSHTSRRKRRTTGRDRAQKFGATP